MTCQDEINAIEEELGPAPAGVYASVRTRLDILEARINNPLVPAPNVENPFYIGGSPISGVSIRDGYGDPNVVLPLFTAVPGSLYLRQDGQNNLYSLEQDGYWHAANFNVWVGVNDLTGTYDFQTVVGIQNNPVSSNTPITGNMFLWDGYAWLPTFLPLNDGYVTGQLPPSNMGTITLTGDVVGANAGGTITTTVDKINGTSVPATPTANQVLVATSGTSATWEQISNAEVSNTAALAVSKLAAGTSAQILLNNSTPTPTWTTITGDIGLTNAGATNVATITGSAGIVQISASVQGNSSASSSPLSYSISNIVMASDANITLTAAQLSCPILRVTSTPSLTATREVILPVVSGASYSVYNHTTGGQSLTFIGSSGTGVTVPNGLKTIIYFDGTNYVTAAIVVGGDLVATTNIAQTVNSIQGVVISGTPSTGYVLEATSPTAASWQAPSGDITLGGDVTGTAPANTVGKIQGNTVTSGALTKGQFFIATSTSNWAATSLSGDITESAVTSGKLTVTALDGYTLPIPSGTISTLQYNAGALTWANLPVSGLVAGTDGYFLQTNGSGIPTWTNLTGDISLSTSGTATVVAIQGNAVQSSLLSSTQDGYLLTWRNSATQWEALAPNIEATNTITSNYTINSSQNDYHIFCNQTGAITVTLPVAVNGVKFEIWDISGTATTNNIVLVAQAGSTIFYPTTLVSGISVNYGHISVVSNGTNWFISP
jgi:hypothetical protein